MKKAYQKPVLYAESYELAEHIAACGIKLNSDNLWVCGIVGGTIPGIEAIKGWFINPENCTGYNNGYSINQIQEYCYTNGCGLNVLHMS